MEEFPGFFDNIDAFHNLKDYDESHLEKLKKKFSLKGDPSEIPKKLDDILSIKDLEEIITANQNNKPKPKINKTTLHTIFQEFNPEKKLFLKKLDGFLGVTLHNLKDGKIKTKLIKKYKNILRTRETADSVILRIKFLKGFSKVEEINNMWKKTYAIDSDMKTLVNNILIDKLKIAYRKLKIKGMDKTLLESENKIKKINEEKNILQSEKKRYEEDIQKLEKQTEQKQKLLKIAETKFKELNEERTSIRKENRRLRDVVTESKKEKEVIDKEIKKNKEIQRTMVNKIVEQQKNINGLQNDFKMIKKDKIELEGKLKNINKEFDKKKDEFDELKKEKEETEVKILEMEEELEEKKEEIAEVEEKTLEMEEELEEMENEKVRLMSAIKFLEKERGRFKDIPFMQPKGPIFEEFKSEPLDIPKKKISEDISKKKKEVKDIDKILKELAQNRKAGTVATIGGFMGITTASILARIVGNTTANYLSPHHKSTTNVVIGNKKDNKQKLIDLILQKRSQDLSELKNDIDHLKERLDDDDRKKNKKSKKTIMHKHKTRNNINLINVINRL